MRAQELVSAVAPVERLSGRITRMLTNWEVCVESGKTLRQNRTQLGYT